MTVFLTELLRYFLVLCQICAIWGVATAMFILWGVLKNLDSTDCAYQARTTLQAIKIFLISFSIFAIFSAAKAAIFTG